LFSPGIKAGYNFISVSNSADFQSLPGVPGCCDNFSEGSGSGSGIWLSLEALDFDYLKIGITLGYSEINSDVVKYENELINVDGESFPGEFRHKIEFDSKIFTATVSAKTNPLDWFFLDAGLGMDFPLRLNYKNSEIITRPLDRGVFGDSGSRSRNLVDGELDNLSKNIFFLRFGAGLELKASSNGNFIFAPGIFYHLPLNSSLDGIDLKSHKTIYSISILIYI
jgi:hypothetical protein